MSKARRNPTRKARSDSHLANLPEETQERIEGWCKEDGLESAASRCSVELQLATSKSALSTWMQWRDIVRPLKRHFDAANSKARAATELLKEIDPQATSEKLHAFGDLMFAQMAMASENTEDFVALGRLKLAKEELEAKINGFKLKYEQKERQLALDVEKFQFNGAKAALAHLKELKAIAADRTLSDPAKIEAVRLKLFGAPSKPLEASPQ